MSTELPKVYEPASVESTAYEVWLKEGCFTADPNAAGEPYCIVIPPPNVTGALHLGHAVNNTLQDILIRSHRMRGFNALWVPGIDHAGIATQAVVEKQLKEKENKTRHDVGREGLVERIWTWKQQYGDRILDQLKRMGASCDWSRTRFTLDEVCAKAVRETFFKLFRDGLIYRGKRLVNWDVHLQTSISDDEIYHETVKTSMWHIRYPIEGTDKRMIVATTRPETMLGDTAVAVHSQDPRWNWAIGKSVKLPLTGRSIPIIADDILVDMEFGSGVVKVTPAHDPNDYAVWQRHQGKHDQIELINILNPDGKINENGGPYAGMKRDAARQKVVADLEAQGLMEKIEPYETQVGHSDRSKTPVEPYLSDQWFVKMAPLAEPALEVVRQGRVQFYPERHAQQYLSWLGEKRDWPISRQLWWGHRIPVWHGRRPANHAIQEAQSRGDCAIFEGGDDKLYVCVPPDRPRMEALLDQHGFTQDPDVLDTWFSSALWPHSTLGWPENTPELSKWYPTSVLVTSRDIITLWVARMVMTGLYNMGEVPFHHVNIHPTILDGKGERMSKSKGNGVDPVDIIGTHGADALRFTLTQMATETQDVRLPVKKLPDGRNTSDKFDAGRNFCNKLWNAARFAISNLESIPHHPVDESRWSLADRWILSRLMRTIRECDEALSAYRFDTYARVCYDFFWRDLCDWYVEAIKGALKDPGQAPQTANVLAAALDGALRLMHPMIPFITETIWWKLNEVRPDRGLNARLPLPRSNRLILAAWPRCDESLVCDEMETVFSRLQELIVAIRNMRNEHKVDQKKPVAVSIHAPGDAARQIEANRSIIEMLAVCTLKAVKTDLAPPADSARAAAAGCEIFVEGLVDQAAEEQRLSKRRHDLANQIAAMKGRLGNAGYIAKAPAHLVEQTKAQLAEAEAELAKIG
ncbi:MAG: valine--tRNA ligase [Phycisphaerales bacterium]|nr:valine--tRNA ligase [Phycisphaerales bacterium]